MKNMIQILLLILLSFLSLEASSQNVSSDTLLSLNGSESVNSEFTGDPFACINIGGGFGFFNENGGGSFGAQLEIVNNKSVFVVRANRVREMRVNIFGNNLFPEKAQDYGVLYGRVLDNSNNMITASVGISYTRIIIRDSLISSYNSGLVFGIGNNYNYDYKTYNLLGVPFQIEIQFHSHKQFNLCLAIFGNINAEYSFGGMLLGFRIGALKLNGK